MQRKRARFPLQVQSRLARTPQKSWLGSLALNERGNDVKRPCAFACDGRAVAVVDDADFGLLDIVVGIISLTRPRGDCIAKHPNHVAHLFILHDNTLKAEFVKSQLDKTRT